MTNLPRLTIATVAASTVIDAALLSLAGITDATLVAALTGKTVSQAASLYIDAFQLAVGASALQRGMIIDINLNGQSSKVSADQAEKVVAFLRRMRSGGGGPVSMQVCLP